ncbi:MAG: RICIN domain-containing protein [Marinilabiliaceae bacterium]|nr:RICIN domain-containing protein [Marinilabiliaceae bacterium]
MKYFLLLIAFVACLGSVHAEEVMIVNKKLHSTQSISTLGHFKVAKGDQVNISIVVDHKRRGIDFKVLQYPGSVCVLDLSEVNAGNYTIDAPADAIYACFYGKESCDFDLKMNKVTNKPNGPNRGAIKFVRKPDTLHVSNHVDRLVGSSYNLEPYKDTVAVATTIMSEQVCSRDFFTGVDILDIPVQGDKKEDYRTQKLLSYNVSLIVQSPGVYDVMTDVVKAGVDEFVPGWTDFCKALPNKYGGKSGANSAELVDDLSKKTARNQEIASGMIELGQEISAEELGNTDFANVAYLVDTENVTKVAMNKGLELAGAPSEVSSIASTVMEIPSPGDLINDQIDRLRPKIKGKANLNIYNRATYSSKVVNIPDKEFIIQSAKEYGKSSLGMLDVPGHPTAAEKGLEVEVWDYDDGKDRLFKFVSSKNQKGYHSIVSALPGGAIALDNQGGEREMMKNGTNIHFWSKYDGKSQSFYLYHMGNGKFKIYNYDGYILCLDGRESKNGSNVHIWCPHSGDFTEWYLVDPLTRQKWVPASSDIKTEAVKRNILTLAESGGAISKTVEISKKTDPLFLSDSIIDLRIEVNKVDFESPAKLLVEAKYMVTDYTDVIRYKKDVQDQYCKDFWTAYKIVYDYDIMYEDMMKDYYQELSEEQFYSPQRPKEEVPINDDQKQTDRLFRYKTLTSVSEK